MQSISENRVYEIEIFKFLIVFFLQIQLILDSSLSNIIISCNSAVLSICIIFINQ